MRQDRSLALYLRRSPPVPTQYTTRVWEGYRMGVDRRRLIADLDV